MNAYLKKQKKPRNLIEPIKWFLIVTSLITAIFVSFYCTKIQFFLYASIIIFFIFTSISFFLLTKKGSKFIAFIHEVTIETKKIICPTPQETLQITLIIIGITILMSFILWGLDYILFNIISFVTGLRLW